jgi:transposase
MSRNLFVGMDVHKDSISIACFETAGTEPVEAVRIANEERALRRLFRRWQERDYQIRSCYEASGAGYVIHRLLRSWGIHCDVIAPSLIPTRPGEQRKHDKRDAIQLARLYRAGELVVIRIPTEAEERVRDLVRSRETFQREILKSRHYVLKFLARRGFVYREGSNWTGKHFSWIRALLTDGALLEEDRVVLTEYLALLEYKLQRREELDRRIEELALLPQYQEAVARLRCFRGIDTHAAMVLATEIGDWRRFERPGQLMAYLGLVPKEHSSGERERRGPITKAGNSHCRHVLVQAAWSYRHPPRKSAALADRQAGQPPHVVAHAWKAQHRLHRVYGRIADRKNGNIAVVAVARELVGFLWASLRDLEEHQQRITTAQAA